MNISRETRQVLQNFSTINSNLVIKAGNKLATISESKTIMAEAQVTESFPQDIGIYDLPEFLSVVGMMDDPELIFEDSAMLVRSGDQSIRYFYSEMEILTQPSKSITMPSVEVSLVLSSSQLAQIRKASSVLRHNELLISNESGSLTASVVNSKDPTANSYTLTINEDDSHAEQFSFYMSIPNLKLIDGDYTVNISSKLISQWINNNTQTNYFVALEKNSSYRG